MAQKVALQESLVPSRIRPLFRGFSTREAQQALIHTFHFALSSKQPLPEDGAMRINNRRGGRVRAAGRIARFEVMEPRMLLSTAPTLSPQGLASDTSQAQLAAGAVHRQFYMDRP